MRLILLLAGIFLYTLSFAQGSQVSQVADQDKMTYQAVILNASNRIVVNGNVSMKVSILQGSANGTASYVETHTGMTNENGLLTLQIGGGTAITGQYDSIDWANGPYFLKTETDPEGGTNYALAGTQQLMSVTFALYAKKTDESDPVYSNSFAAGISGTDTAYWNSKVDTVIETDPVYSNSVAAGITGTDTAYWNSKVDTVIETDPVFSNSVAAGITGTDTAYWNSKVDTVIETDPVFDTSVAAAITSADTTRWNNKQNSLIPGPGFLISNDSLKMTQKHYVGEHFGGGVVCYVTPDGEHGLILAYEDLPDKHDWSDNSYSTILGTSYVDGLYNTNLIVNDPDHTVSAAKACMDWVNPDYGQGAFDDWYLPAVQEVMTYRFQEPYTVMESLLYDNNPNSTWFEDGEEYWTSSEDNQYNEIEGETRNAIVYVWDAGYYFYDYDALRTDFKYYNTYVRCVRRF